MHEAECFVFPLSLPAGGGEDKPITAAGCAHQAKELRGTVVDDVLGGPSYMMIPQQEGSVFVFFLPPSRPRVRPPSSFFWLLNRQTYRKGIDVDDEPC